MIYLFCISCVYILLIAIIYFSKKKIDNYDNKIYKKVLIINIVGIFIDIIQYLLIVKGVSDVIIIIFNKAFLIYILLWTTMFSLYVLNVGNKAGNPINRNISRVLYFIFTLFSLISLFLPITYHNSNNQIYTYGLGVTFTYFAVGMYIAIMVIGMLKNFIQQKGKINKKIYIPLYVYMLLGIISTIVQNLFPYLLLTSSVETFITILTYFFIENPDVQLIEQLNVAKDAADRANSAKSDFLSSMSHEIRTPLNAIVGFSNGLLESDDLPETAKGDVKNIIMASDNLLELVNGILDISKIEAGKLEIIDVNYSFNKIFDELVLLTKARLGEKPLDFRYSYDSTIPQYLYGDGTRVKQIVLNLLTNAVKYTKTGYVDFKVNSVIRGDVVRLIICVEDSGIGIKKESIEKLFTKFERLDVEKNSTIEGTGLGLAITKKLTEMMGGTIVVQSVYGQGSKFTVSIDQKIVTGEELEKLKRENDNSVNAEEVVDGHGKRILVVDDNNLNIKVAERLLGKFNVVIDSCSSGFDCVNKITSGEKYDLLLLDDMMPKMSGTETLHKLKEVNGFNTPVIVLTANAITGMREKYLSEGFDDYLSKPIEKQELSRVIKKYLS